MTQNGKLSSELFWIGTRSASTFHFSGAIKQPTFHLNIPRLLQTFFIYFVLKIFFLSSHFCCPHQEDSWGLCSAGSSGSGVEKIPAIRMSEHVLQHRAWWEKQTPRHMKSTSAFGQPWMWSIGFPKFQFFTLFSICTHCRLPCRCFGDFLSCLAVQMLRRRGAYKDADQ